MSVFVAHSAALMGEEHGKKPRVRIRGDPQKLFRSFSKSDADDLAEKLRQQREREAEELRRDRRRSRIIAAAAIVSAVAAVIGTVTLLVSG